MPLVRYHIRDELRLADPKVYEDVDIDDPEALLKGVAMASLIGILRQLGDLANRKQFSKKQAENWWAENGARVYKKYNNRIVERNLNMVARRNTVSQDQSAANERQTDQMEEGIWLAKG